MSELSLLKFILRQVFTHKVFHVFCLALCGRPRHTAGLSIS